MCTDKLFITNENNSLSLLCALFLHAGVLFLMSFPPTEETVPVAKLVMIPH